MDERIGVIRLDTQRKIVLSCSRRCCDTVITKTLRILYAATRTVCKILPSRPKSPSPVLQAWRAFVLIVGEILHLVEIRTN